MDISLIIGALDFELSGALSLLKINKKIINNNTVLYKGKYNNKKYWVVKTGIGKANTLEALSFLKNKIEDIKIIYNIGFCGSMSKTLNIGDTLNYEKVKKIDLNTKSIYEKGNISIGRIPGFNNVTGGTSESLINNNEQKEFLLDKMKVEAIDMESYYIANAFKNKIPLRIIRIVSDTPDLEFPEFFKDFSKGNIKSGLKSMIKYSLSLRNIKKLFVTLKNIRKAKSSLYKAIKLLVLH